MHLPKRCQDRDGWHLITRLIDAQAYPGPYQIWTKPSSLDATQAGVLDDLVIAGLVIELKPNQFQVTESRTPSSLLPLLRQPDL